MCFVSLYHLILWKGLVADQDMNTLCCRQKRKKAKYAPVVFIRKREQKVSAALGEAMCVLWGLEMQLEKLQVNKHCLLCKQAQPSSRIINTTVLVRNNFWLFIQYNQGSCMHVLCQWGSSEQLSPWDVWRANRDVALANVPTGKRLIHVPISLLAWIKRHPLYTQAWL